MLIYALLATGCGAFLGACLRYLFGLWLNPIFPTVPLGTLAADDSDFESIRGEREFQKLVS